MNVSLWDTAADSHASCLNTLGVSAAAASQAGIGDGFECHGKWGPEVRQRNRGGWGSGQAPPSRAEVAGLRHVHGEEFGGWDLEGLPPHSPPTHTPGGPWSSRLLQTWMNRLQGAWVQPELTASMPLAPTAVPAAWASLGMASCEGEVGRGMGGAGGVQKGWPRGLDSTVPTTL